MKNKKLKVKISKRDVAVVLLFNKKREILLQKKSLDYCWFPERWCLFGGGVEKDEKPEKALIRELKEELNYKLTNKKFLGVEKYQDKVGESFREGKQHVFYVLYKKQNFNVLLKEGADFAFFSYDKLDAVDIVDHDLKIIKKYYSGLFNND